jgi:hypothetical protein
MRQEKWKAIDGYDSIYEVSNLGRIRRIKSKRILKAGIVKTGYAVVHLYKQGIPSTHRVNRLVALAFIPNPSKKSVVNHKNRNKLDNKADNLEWNSVTENSIHAHKTELLSAINLLENTFDQNELEQKYTLREILNKLKLQVQ